MPLMPLTDTRPQPADVAPTARRPVRLTARDLPASGMLGAHSHRWGQITYAMRGTIRVSAGNGTWIVPPSRAIWIPPAVAHEVVALEPALLRALYVHGPAAPFADGACRVIDVSALLRELIAALADSDPSPAREAMLAALILDETARSTVVPLRIALPADKRLRAFCDMLIADPASTLTLEQHARRAGASSRTLARLFERELGMRFGQWRQQLRLAHAAPMIAAGMPLAQVAAAAGYASQSAFAAMFQRTFGVSPSGFLNAGAG
ncbi:MAG: AraC family transcriptional regulator [Burkholderiaceae bacterium]